MTSKQHLKKELMLYALRNDFCAYGTVVKKNKNGTYTVYADGEKYHLTNQQLVKDFDSLSQLDKEDIISGYLEDELKGEENAS